MPKISNSFKNCIKTRKLRLGTSNLEKLEISTIEDLVGAITVQHPAGIYLFKGNNGNSREMCEICSKQWFKVNNEDTR